MKDKDIILFNHFKIHIHYDNNNLNEDEIVIVGFEIEPISIGYSGNSTCTSEQYWSLQDKKLKFSYDVVFEVKYTLK